MDIKFPMLKKSKHTGLIVEFIEAQTAKVIVADSRYHAGYMNDSWTECTNEEIWGDIDPGDFPGEPTEEEIDNMEEEFTVTEIDVGSKYQKKMKNEIMDVYNVLKSFNVTCPATQHAIKKLLMPGSRGIKTKKQDLEEAHNSIKRAIELLEE